MYIKALKNSRFNEEFTYLKPKVPNNINNKLDINTENMDFYNKLYCRKNRKREIICFNHTFCELNIM